jgi:hypothetical protein
MEVTAVAASIEVTAVAASIEAIDWQTSFASSGKFRSPCLTNVSAAKRDTP